MLQDGSEKVIESLSLIDAVMPDVVETRKQAVSKTAQIKTEATSANGEEASSISKKLLILCQLLHVVTVMTVK